VSIVEADAAIMNEVGGVYDEVPSAPYGEKTAYLSFGPETMRPEDLVCITQEAHILQIDTWSKAVGRVQCKQICGDLKRLLDGAEIALSHNALVSSRHLITRYLDDPEDGLKHGVVQFEFLVEIP
jgi:hypothetical protein